MSDDLQFGFKEQLGCPTALFLLKQVVNDFNERNNNVYIASFDASKAVDRVNHYKLFSNLISNNLPNCFVKLIINWYLKMSVCIRWNVSILVLLVYIVVSDKEVSYHPCYLIYMLIKLLPV